MKCQNCIHKEVCEGLFPFGADEQECKHYHGTCRDCEQFSIKIGTCCYDAIHYDPDAYCSGWSERNEVEDNE